MEYSSQLNSCLEINYGISLENQPFSDEVELAKVLSLPIQKMLEEKNTLLLQILYRRDISELRVKNILHQYSIATASYKIATLIIQREIEKIQTKNKYSQENKKDEDCSSW